MLRNLLHPRRTPAWEIVTTLSAQASQSPFESSNYATSMHTRTYIFELPSGDKVATSDVRRAVQRAREMFILEPPQSESTHRRLINEGWKLTIQRRGEQNRVEVIYSAGVTNWDTESLREDGDAEPPFLNVIDSRLW